jgi:hypothetical protein
MSAPNEPKGPPGAPVEGPTKAFRVKFDGWMDELLPAGSGEAPAASAAELLRDLGLEPPPPADEPAAAPEEPGGAPTPKI